MNFDFNLIGILSGVGHIAKSFIVPVGMLFTVGLLAGLRLGAYHTAGPVVAIVWTCLLAAGTALARWVLVIDPHRDTGTVPLPLPWSAVLPVLAAVLFFTCPSIVGGFVGLSIRDFTKPGRRPLIRLIGYVIATVSLVCLAPWVFVVTID